MAANEIDWESELGKLVSKIRQLNAGYDRAYEAPVLKTSIRAADDAATWPLAIGQHVTYCLVQAIDMCEGIADLVTNETGLQVPLTATYPLARAAIESASVAVWMLAPQTRRERVIRRLQAAHDEIAFEKAFINSVAEGMSASKEQAMRRANAKDANHLKRRMKEIARVNGIDPDEYTETMPGWKDIVEAGGSVLRGEPGSLLVAAWRFTSGLTHPSFLRGRVAHEFVQTAPDAEAFCGEITVNISWLVSTASIAHRLTRAALVEYYLTKGKVNGERPVPAPRRPV